MRKKLLSLLTVLCLVLGMLPATALAAEYADLAADLGYSEEEVAMYIDEDTELSEDVEGLIIVVAPVKVTVKGAKLTTGLLVAPGAKGASVTLGENADVNALIVMDTAEVTVEEKAVAASVTVTAPETKVAVAGEVKTVTVAEEAEKAAVTVAETAKVETVEVSAPAAAVEVAGEVATVAVAETAAAATVTVAETAKVTGDVTNAAPESNVSIKGEVAGSVTTAETAKGATTEVAETAKVTGTVTNAAPDSSMKVEGKVEGGITNTETATGATLEVGEKAEITGEVTDATGEMAVTGDGAANVTVTPAEPAEGDKKDEEEKKDEESEEKKDESTDYPYTPELPVIIHKADPGFTIAHLVDRTDGNTSWDADDPQASPYTKTVVNGAGANEFTMTITAKNLEKHLGDASQGAGNQARAWVGVAIPHPDDGHYDYYLVSLRNPSAEMNTANNGLGKQMGHATWGAGEPDNPIGKDYDTLYFDAAAFVDVNDPVYRINIVHRDNEECGEGEPTANVTPDYVLDIVFDVTLKPEESVNALSVEDDAAEDAPVADAPVADAPVADAPIADAPIENAPIENAPIENAPVENAPAEDAPVVDTPIEDDVVDGENA